MSITMNLFYTGTNGGARKFVEEMECSGIAALIRAEAGNEGYQYFFPIGDQETVLLIDRWTDQAAIDAHHKSDMMQTIASPARQTYYTNLPPAYTFVCEGEPFYCETLAYIEALRAAGGGGGGGGRLSRRYPRL